MTAISAQVALLSLNFHLAQLRALQVELMQVLPWFACLLFYLLWSDLAEPALCVAAWDSGGVVHLYTLLPVPLCHSARASGITSL